MEEFFTIILLGMIVYIPIGVMIGLLVWLHDSGIFKGELNRALRQSIPSYLQSPDYRLAAAAVLAILLGVSPLVMIDHFIAGIILFISSILILAVIRGLVPMTSEAGTPRSLL